MLKLRLLQEVLDKMAIEKTFDFEVFFEQILELFETQYNNCLSEINTSKGLQDNKDIPAKLIPQGRYFFGGATQTQIGNEPIFISYDFANANEVSDSVLTGQAETITLNFAINIIDNRMDNNNIALKHLLRYHRAMIKMINKNQGMFGGFGRLEIVKLAPIVSDIAGTRIRSAGVSISMTTGS